MTTKLETCENCGITGEGASAWGGYCHDCDNQLEATQYEEDECQEPMPETISVREATFTGGAVAECSDCLYRCVYWECPCDLIHDCEDFPLVPDHHEFR